MKKKGFIPASHTSWGIADAIQKHQTQSATGIPDQMLIRVRSIEYTACKTRSLQDFHKAGWKAPVPGNEIFEDGTQTRKAST